MDGACHQRYTHIIILIEVNRFSPITTITADFNVPPQQQQQQHQKYHLNHMKI